MTIGSTALNPQLLLHESAAMLARSWAPLVLALLVTVLAWSILSRRIGQWRRERLNRLKKHRAFDAVSTASPYDNSEEQARAAALDNVQARFSVMRVLLAVTAGGLIFVVALLPLLDDLPQALLSFLIAIALAVVGVAARPMIENFISGMVLSFSRQLKVGDTVLLDAEHYGTVEDINATHTVLKLWDWRRYVVPNSSMLQKEVVSYSHKDQFLWTHVPFHVAPDADMELIERLAMEAAGESRFLARFEEPQFWVREMLPESNLCWLAAWAKNPEDAWYLRSDIRKALVQRLRAHGVKSQLSNHDAKWHSDRLS